MTRHVKLATLLSVGGALLISGLANAQDPAAPPAAPPGDPAAGGAPGGAPATGGAGSLGTVSNETTFESTTTTTGTDLGGDATTLPNTGGAPLLMVLAGSLTAGGAFLLRRKIS